MTTHCHKNVGERTRRTGEGEGMLTECTPSPCRVHARPQPACAGPVLLANPGGRDGEPISERSLREPGVWPSSHTYEAAPRGSESGPNLRPCCFPQQCGDTPGPLGWKTLLGKEGESTGTAWPRTGKATGWTLDGCQIKDAHPWTSHQTLSFSRARPGLSAARPSPARSRPVGSRREWVRP